MLFILLRFIPTIDSVFVVISKLEIDSVVGESVTVTGINTDQIVRQNSHLLLQYVCSMYLAAMRRFITTLNIQILQTIRSHLDGFFPYL